MMIVSFIYSGASEVFLGVYQNMYLSCCLVLSAFFDDSLLMANESDSMVEVCVGKSHITIPNVELNLESRDGTATGNTMQCTTQLTLNYCSHLLLFL